VGSAGYVPKRTLGYGETVKALIEPNSLWHATAGPGPAMPPLVGDLRAGVCVIGAGFTGLSAALHLAESGAEVVVLDAVEAGFGASGRNGGQVIPGLKLDPETLRKRLGDERGEALAREAGSAPSMVYELIERLGIDADLQRAGWISAAHCQRALDAQARLAEQWATLGAEMHPLDASEMERLTGSREYPGGMLDRRGGSLNPLGYARGLAGAAQARGAVLHRALARELVPDGARWRVRTAEGPEVVADQVVLATNGYSDLCGSAGPWRGIARSVMPVYSYQVATIPLPSHLRAVLLPHGHVLSDTRRLLAYFRLDSGGRFIMGGRGGRTESDRVADYAGVRAMMHRVYPELRGIDITFRWGGRVALTLDHLPHLHRPASGLYAALGYNGRGVAMASLTGAWLARLVAGEQDAAIPLPVTPLRAIPLHGLRRPLIALAVGVKRWLDQRESRQTRPKPG
jgi:glycine/D-amino acid oxidase-like deaminating enzyme